MKLRIGIAGVAHVHAPSYWTCVNAHEQAELSGVWDHDSTRGREAAERSGTSFSADLSELMKASDAIIIAAENLKHADLIEQASNHGLPILCEKPLAASWDELERIQRSGAWLMTAFPCPFAPAFARLIERVNKGEIGKVLSVCATNRGTCPGGWFTEPELSGGGAMIDHTVHVADLLRRLLNETPVNVTATIGNNMNAGEVDDSALVLLDFPSGIFATIDASWSRKPGFKTWGDVTLNVVGDQGVIEIDLFGQEVDVYQDKHRVAGFGSNLDQTMVDEFISAILEKREPRVTLQDGLEASKVALEAYRSTEQSPVAS